MNSEKDNYIPNVPKMKYKSISKTIHLINRHTMTRDDWYFLGSFKYVGFVLFYHYQNDYKPRFVAMLLLYLYYLSKH